MPPRRRAGYQPDELSEQMQDAIAAEAARLDALGDDLRHHPRPPARCSNALEDAILESKLRLRAKQSRRPSNEPVRPVR